MSESNPEDSEVEQKSIEVDNSRESSVTVFSYDQLKAKSNNPLTGIDSKRREVSDSDVGFFA